MDNKTVERSVSKYSSGAFVVSFPDGKLYVHGSRAEDYAFGRAFEPRTLVDSGTGVFPDVPFTDMLNGMRAVENSLSYQGDMVEGGVEEADEDDYYDDRDDDDDDDSGGCDCPACRY